MLIELHKRLDARFGSCSLHPVCSFYPVPLAYRLPPNVWPSLVDRSRGDWTI